MNARKMINVINGAIWHLNNDGWGQFRYYNHNTNCYCLSGAIWQAGKQYGLNTTKDVLELVASQASDLSWVSAEGRIVSWNDQEGRTKDEAIELLRSAREALKFQQSGE